MPTTSTNVPALRVIDVAAQKVIAPPEKCEYVVLSYVWGARGPNAFSSIFPKVAENSLVVTSTLGYKYLWVDKYCIDQNNAHGQIKAMHLVYGNTQLTLIAAAVDDSHYGLRGVGTRHRQEQQSACVGDTTFAETFLHASDTLNASRWATRGWTYQEGLLAKRRFIFTDHQVSFPCMPSP
ncbi:heterokaryon incompatibility protein-domain-containing protein [Halenospora varia]|nr:heterokaryon incompatibility protein-domain-containing protein [Halenospora varia]